MLRSMYSGISGMKVNQTKLDVIGNNIANVNTTSYKSSRATFSDLLSQSSASAQAASNTKGGINAKQVGLGVQLSSIDRIMTQGSMQTTSRSLDLGLDGNGYFMVSTGPIISGDGAIEVSHAAGTHSINEKSLASSGASISYTRDGSFTLDNEGNLLTTDGYRVLGYSVTNDDNSQRASEAEPNPVNMLGLTFSFTAGTQLNGVTIQLGKVSQGTATSASLTGEGTNRVLTINGDFSNAKLDSEEITRAINKELAAKGISQTVKVSGKLNPLSGVASSKITGGKDAQAPDTVSVLGYTIQFNNGDAANGYKIVVEDIADGSARPTARKDESKQCIYLSGNFAGNSTITEESIKEALNNAGFGNIVSKVTKSGSSSISSLYKQVEGYKENEKAKVTTTSGTSQGFSVEFKGYSDDFNGYTIQFVNDITANGNSVIPNLNTSNNTLTVKGNFSGTPSLTDAEITKQINKYLLDSGIKDTTVTVTGTHSVDDTGSITCNRDGVDSITKSVTIAGMKINFPETKDFAGHAKEREIYDKLGTLKFRIGTVKEGTATNADYDSDSNTITISGDFTVANGINTTELAKQISDALTTELGIGPGTTLKFTRPSNGNDRVDNLKSDKITGGTKLTTPNPDTIKAFGLEFKVGERTGAMLNNYSFELGTIAAGTKPDVTIDEKSKKIIISGDFVNENAITADVINEALAKKLESTFGKDVTVNVTGDPVFFGGTVQGDKPAEGGSSVQSIRPDGAIRFVSASSDVYAYDDSLKTLKIPEKVLSADGKTEVAVKSYSISSNGIITATLQDGTIAALGQIALASFSNPAGLTSVGGNLYSVSSNSGAATIMSGLGTTGENNSDAYGNMLSGYLEMSNVDLAEQFTDMITTTKAFQGASKMITTGDEILTEIINLKR